MLEKDSIFLQQYQILGNLGKGGMGKVYLAEDIKNHKKYAVKEQQITEKNLQLILSEINIQKKLNNPALPQIALVHKTETHIYIIMDYIQGRTLEAMLEETGFFPQDRVRKWASQICNILQYLHSLEQPVVYRDLKPSNIMIDYEDNVRLIDFGIAQEYENTEHIEQSKKKSLTLTRGYAAPEQYDSRYRADVRTDIYALGVTLHYLLTGKNPLKPPYHFEKVRKLKSEISYAMEEVVRKCLQPNPDHRYATAEILYHELTNLEELEQKLAQKRRLRIITTSAASLVVAVLLVFIYLTVGQNRNTKITHYYDTLLEAEQNIEEMNYEEAYLLITESIAYQPKAEEGYLAMAKWYREQKQYEECFQYMNEEVLSRFPDIYDNEEFLNLMGSLYMEVNKPSQAEFYWKELCREYSDNVEYLYYLASCYLMQDKFTEAETVMEQLKEKGADSSILQKLEQQRG